MTPEIIVGWLYKLFLFRDADEPGVQGKSGFLKEKGLGDGLEKLVINILHSKEKDKKITANKFSCYRVKGEDKRQMRDLLALIRGLTGYKDGSKFLWFLAAEISYALGDYEEASQYHKELKSSSDSVVKKLSMARWCQWVTLGIDDAGAKFTQYRLTEWELSGWHLDSVEKIAGSVEKQEGKGSTYLDGLTAVAYHSDAVADIIGEYIKNNLAEIPSDMLREMVRQCCLLKGVDGGNADILAKAFEAGGGEGEINLKNDFPQDVLVVGGFHWSGSSAVHDFFKDTGLVSTTGIEAASYVGGLGKVLYGENKKDGLRKYFLSHILNVYLSGSGRGMRRHNFSLLPNFLRKGKPGLDCFSHAVRGFMDEASCSEGARAREALVSLLYECSDINPGTGRLVLDQAPTAMNLKALRNLPEGAKYIAVFRDPRDLYVEQIGKDAIGRGVYSDVYGFIEKYLKDREQYFATREALSDSYYFMETSFERFVMDEGERRKVAEYAGIEFKENKKYFDSNKSIANVGKYKRYADQDSIRIIEESLIEYINDH